METTDTLAVVGLVIFGIIVGYFAAREGNSRDEVHGGSLAQGLNYIASALMISIAPSVLVMALIMHPEWITISGIDIAPFVQMLGIALTMMAIAYLLTIPMAMLEKPHLLKLASQEDSGWTEADARSSGL